MNAFKSLDKIIPTSHVKITGTFDRKTEVHTVFLSTFAPGSVTRVLRASASNVHHDEACREAAEQLASIWKAELRQALDLLTDEDTEGG